jgi:hypothetical protein
MCRGGLIDERAAQRTDGLMGGELTGPPRTNMKHSSLVVVWRTQVAAHRWMNILTLASNYSGEVYDQYKRASTCTNTSEHNESGDTGTQVWARSFPTGW